MFKQFLMESLEDVKESVVAPYVGQMINTIGKEKGIGFQVTFVNDKIVKVKMPNGSEKTFTRKVFENEFSLGGEAANESLIREEYGDLVKQLRDIADQLDNQKWVDGLNEIANEMDGIFDEEDFGEIEDMESYEEEEEEPEMQESKKRGRPSKK